MESRISTCVRGWGFSLLFLICFASLLLFVHYNPLVLMKTSLSRSSLVLVVYFIASYLSVDGFSGFAKRMERGTGPFYLLDRLIQFARGINLDTRRHC